MDRNLNHVDHALAVLVAEGVGVEPPAEAPALSQDHDPVQSTDTGVSGGYLALSGTADMAALRSSGVVPPHTPYIWWVFRA
ncbi:hypothetical protein [Streptosporangium sp. NPDC087985]|uniref:hypothetical protein n=1 Tax=Streptosporangium sp. NPDC087985 TaxID=3366196 RepID=UPI00382EBDD0